MRDVLSPREWHEVNHFLKEIENPSSTVVSVYAPISEASNMINILSETERGEEIEEIETLIEKRLSVHKDGTLCIFGWNTESGVQLKELTLSKVLPPIYVVDEKPFTEPLHDILEINYDVLLLVLDHKEARFQHFKGKEMSEQSRIKAYVRGKHSKGGWSQKRFERIRSNQIRDFFKRVESRLKVFAVKDFVLLAGPGTANKEFFQLLSGVEKKKTRILEGVNFNTSQESITEKVIASLDSFRKNIEYQQLLKVEGSVKKGLIEKDNKKIHEALLHGAVDTILIASDYFAKTPQENKRIIKMIELAEKTSVEVEFITNPEVLTKLHKHGSVVASLRY